MKVTARVKSFGGEQLTVEHDSTSCHCTMTLGVYLPPQARQPGVKLPVLYWLSGLTCTHENFTTKAGAQRIAAALGVMLVMPDTSPRGEGVRDDADGAYDFGLGAGFYLDATEVPYAEHYRMHAYISEELPGLIEAEFPVDPDRAGIFGHSMGGHGALTIHLKHPSKFKTCSAFSPIVAPSQVPWGQKAFSNYLGTDETSWAAYDATTLLGSAGASSAHILIDQGTADNFLAEQLKPELFDAAARKAGQALTVRMQEGYDHSYYFIASFIEDHIRHHVTALG